MGIGEFIIYCLVDPRDRAVRYVGMTQSPDERLRRHLQDAKRGSTRRANWIRSLVSAGVTPEMIEIERGHDWHEPEQFWIAYFKAIGADLVNGNEGGRCAVVETASKPWTAGERGVRCPSAIYLKAAASAGVSPEFRAEARRRLAKMSEADRCNAELRFAQLMHPRDPKPIDRWIEAAGERALAVACG